MVQTFNDCNDRMTWAYTHVMGSIASVSSVATNTSKDTDKRVEASVLSMSLAELFTRQVYYVSELDVQGFFKLMNQAVGSVKLFLPSNSEAWLAFTYTMIATQCL